MIDEDKFKIRAIDPTNIAVVNISLLFKGFEEYTAEKKDIIGLDLERVEEFLKIKVDPKDLFELSKEGGKLKIK